MLLHPLHEFRSVVSKDQHEFIYSRVPSIIFVALLQIKLFVLEGPPYLTWVSQQ